MENTSGSETKHNTDKLYTMVRTYFTDNVNG